MAYTNVIIDSVFDLTQSKSKRMMEAELAFWQNAADILQAKLENIPEAIAKYGYVDIISKSGKIRLIKEPTDNITLPAGKGDGR